MATSEYYDKQLQDGLEFQDLVAVQFFKIGLSVKSFSSIAYQIKKGENLQGFEIKHDKNFRETKNLWIELQEKSKVENINYVDSGVNRADNTILYCQGDYEGIFIMQKKCLKNIIKPYRSMENKMKTSIGVLLPTKVVFNWFDYYDFIKEEYFVNIKVKNNNHANE